MRIRAKDDSPNIPNIVANIFLLLAWLFMFIFIGWRLSELF